jgi:hypothetical protein
VFIYIRRGHALLLTPRDVEIWFEGEVVLGLGDSLESGLGASSRDPCLSRRRGSDRVAIVSDVPSQTPACCKAEWG